MGVIFIADITVILVSRGEETLVDDGDKHNDGFVPDLPPMEPPKD